jgi:pilus assembly protein CpaE
MNTRVRVLIVENLPEIARHLNKLLNLIENVEVVNEVKSAQEAKEMIRVVKPEVALIDTNLPDMNGIKLTEIIRREFPVTQVVIISQDKFFDTVVRAMRDGAADFLTHDVNLEELSAAINRAADISIAERERTRPISGMSPLGSDFGGDGSTPEGKIITVYSPKGGSGTTTIAINIAVALQNTDTTIGLVDGSMQFGDVAISLNEVTKFSILDLVPRVYELDKKIIEDTMVLHKSSGLHVLAAPSRPEFAEKISGAGFMKVLEYLRNMFTYVIVNTSSYISDPCLAALDAAETIVLVTTQEIAAIKNTRSFLDLWEELGLSKERILLVLNRYRKNIPITPEKVSERLRLDVAVTIPEDEQTIFKAGNLGVPFILERKELPVYQSIDTIASLINQRQEPQSVESRFRLFTLS